MYARWALLLVSCLGALMSLRPCRIVPRISNTGWVMQFPKAGANYAQERLGIAATQTYAAQRRQIWRETGTGDVGVDGHLEFVTPDGFATSRIVAVQVKSGLSYFDCDLLVGGGSIPRTSIGTTGSSFRCPSCLCCTTPIPASHTGPTFGRHCAIPAPKRPSSRCQKTTD